MSKGTRVYSLRIPPEVMAQVQDFVARNFDRYPNGELTVTKFIVDAIRERFGKLDRAKRSGQRQRGRKEGGVLHPHAEHDESAAISLADTGLSDGTKRDAV